MKVSQRRLRATVAHLAFSALVAAVVAGVVFGLWYPSPFGLMSGSLSLFLLLMGVDVVAGPVLTAVVAAPGKPRREFARDMVVIVAIQLAALSYGAYAIWLARPVLVAFEVDRLRVVTIADIDRSQLSDAPEGLRSLPATGPRLIAVVKPQKLDDVLRSIELGLAGVDLSMVPANWRAFDAFKHQAWERARPLPQLLARYTEVTAEVEAMARDANVPAGQLRFIPLQSKHANWTAVVAGPDFRIVGGLPVDAFF